LRTPAEVFPLRRPPNPIRIDGDAYKKDKPADTELYFVYPKTSVRRCEFIKKAKE
jgi:hypothetical protein